MTWLSAQGYACIFDGDGVNKECDTATCNHCNTVFHIKPGMHPSDIGGFCRICEKIICCQCVGDVCIPFEKRLDAIEARDRARRSYGI